MLSFLIDQMSRGVDIAEHYPALYRQLLSEPVLHQVFLDALALLRRNGAQDLDPLPGLTRPGLDFLARTIIEPQLSQTIAGDWRVSWYVDADRLTSLFGSEPLLGDDLGRDLWTPIFLTEVVVDRLRFVVALEAEHTIRDKKTAVVRVGVTVYPGPDSAPPPPIQALISWGSVNTIIPVGPTGRATFPPHLLPASRNVLGQIRVRPLRFWLESV